MSTANTDAADLNTAGNINEDVMQQIFDISPVETPFTNSVGVESADRQYTEWLTDALLAVVASNSRVDGADAGSNITSTATRVGNHCQISDKVVRVSGRAQSVNTIGRSNELAYQLLQRGKELRRDVEAIALMNQASRADDGNTNSGRVGGVPCWFTTNTSRGGTGANGGFTGGAVALPTVGTKRALTETILRDLVESAYIAGGAPSDVMTTPKMKRRISEYLFSSSARIGTITTETGGQGGATAIGAIDVFVTDFGVLKLTPNRFQLTYDLQNPGSGAYGGAAVSDVFVFDFMYWAMSYLRGYRTEPLAKTGDADNRQMLVDWTVCCKNEASSAIAADIDQAVAMTA